MSRILRYRAGPSALRILHDEGLTPHTLAAVAGPASGPKWIVLAGLDRALLRSGLLRPPSLATIDPGRPNARPLLVGASAGAWRMLALASRDPHRAHRRLLDGYVGMTFGRQPGADQVSRAYRRMLAGIFPDDEVAHLAEHPCLDLAAHVVRPRIAAGWSSMPRVAQMLSLTAAGLLQMLSRSGTRLVFERVLFHTRPDGFSAPYQGRVVGLDRGNLLDVIVASGTVPFYMRSQRDLPGAPRGHYLDGGLADYHLRQRYAAEGRGITLFPHFQRRIVPAWFDRSLQRRVPENDVLDNVLQVHPSEEFLARLPDGRPPDRNDFFRFSEEPAERIRRWREAARNGEALGDAFLEDLEQGLIPELAEPLHA